MTALQLMAALGNFNIGKREGRIAIEHFKHERIHCYSIKHHRINCPCRHDNLQMMFSNNWRFDGCKRNLRHGLLHSVYRHHRRVAGDGTSATFHVLNHTNWLICRQIYRVSIGVHFLYLSCIQCERWSSINRNYRSIFEGRYSVGIARDPCIETDKKIFSAPNRTWGYLVEDVVAGRAEFRDKRAFGATEHSERSTIAAFFGSCDESSRDVFCFIRF